MQPSTLHILALSDLPTAPPPFADVVELVEAVEGVRFRALFEQLPRTVPDGDAALATIWQLVAEVRGRSDGGQQRQNAILASMPSAIQAAFELDGEQFSAALGAALAELPDEEAETIVQQLRAADLIGGSAGPDTSRTIQEFEPLLQGIAAATANEGLRGEIEPVLAQIQEDGWMLRQPARRIWAGERDEAALTEGLDEQDSALVRRILELLEE